MLRSVAIVSALLLVSSASAQEKLPPRFDTLAKNDRLRLVRVLGMPELQPNYFPISAISADGKWAIYAEDLSSGDAEKPKLKTRLLLYDLEAKTWPREFDINGKMVNALDLSRDGSKVLLAGQFVATKEKNTQVRACLILFDLRTGMPIETIDTMDDRYQCVALGPDEATALTATAGIKQWDLKKRVSSAAYHPNNTIGINVLAYLPNGKQFLAGYAAGQIRLFDVGKEMAVRTYAGLGKGDIVLLLAVAPDGKRFAAGDLQAGIALWDTATGKDVGKLLCDKRPDEEMIAGLALADDGKTLVAAWSKIDPAAGDSAPARVVAWDAENKKTLWSQTGVYRGQLPMRTKEGNLLIGGGPNLFETWNIKDGKKLNSWGAHRGQVNALAVLPSGDILSAGQDAQTLTWRAGKLIRRQSSDGGAVNVIAQSKDRKQWLGAAADHAIRLYAADGAKPLQVMKGHTGPVTSLAFSTDGNWAASGSEDRAAKTWDLKSGREIASFAGHSEGVNAVAISPDDRWLATGSSDAAIKLWPIKDGKLDPDRETITLEGHKKPVTCLAFSADGKTLISGSQDQTLKVWDWAKEKAIRTIPGHKNWITSLLLIDAKTAVTTSDDLTLCWWDLDTGKELGRLDFGVVGDCPRCVARLGPDRLLVGTSSWLIFEVQMLPAGKAGK